MSQTPITPEHVRRWTEDPRISEEEVDHRNSIRQDAEDERRELDRQAIEVEEDVERWDGMG